MSRLVKLEGPKTGDRVDISVRQGGRVREHVVSAWQAAASGPAEVVITTHRSPGLRFAPEGMHFEAEVTGPTGLPPVVDGENRDGSTNPEALYTHYDPQFHELEFVWETSQTGDFPLTGRHPGALRAKGIGHGKHIAHVFETAGDHWVRCSVYRTDYASGRQTTTLVAQNTIALTVDTLESQIPVHRRIYVSTALNDPDFNTLPTGTRLGVADAGDLHGAVKNLAEDTGNTAIFLKRGQQYVSNQRSFSSNGNCYWGSWGSDPARPLIENGSGPDEGVNTGLIKTPVNPAEEQLDTLTIHDIELRGQWDDLTETRIGGTPQRLELGIDLFVPAWVTIVGCKVSGFDTNITFRGECPLSEAPRASMILWDTESTGWRDYGTFVSNDAWGLMVGVVGCRYGNGATANSNMGLHGKPADRNSHAPVRTASHYRLYAAQNDVSHRFGWSVPALQPGFRLTTESWGYYPEAEPQRIVFWGNMIENAGSAASFGIAGYNHPSLGNVRVPYPLNALVKNNFILGGWGNSEGFTVNYGGTSVIENIYIRPDIPLIRPDETIDAPVVRPAAGQVASFNPLVDDVERPGSSTTGNRNHPVRYIGNTLIDRHDYSNPSTSLNFEDPATNVAEPFTGHIEFRDNVYFVAGGASAETSQGPMEHALAITPRITRGPTFDWPKTRTYQTYDQMPDGTNLVAGPGDLDVVRPAATSPAVGAATGAMSRSDILGNLRPQTASAGAIESA